MERHRWPYRTMKALHHLTSPYLPVAIAESVLEFKVRLPRKGLPIGTPDRTADYGESVTQTTPFIQKGRIPSALVDDHHGQKLSQWHLDPERRYSALRSSHNVASKVVP
eukprot:1849895-Amphidinium_carterae.1